ncbi:ribonuclease D [Dyella mobilis]|uniref:HRDC domain-containing protein n=1 Tax=Dyella mobilis TaxID=1849582 RepID=A0ABS2KJZ8_9GAMM|nr:HRDC domain-containing protein [Dyella mobilis]MBM7131481.1 HRDC domain-containing protein [Dyella mobilis]GLQ96545.1 ribonuclease D [Dyella mobilis]
MPLPVTPPHADWITQRSGLEQWLAGLSSSATLALDTEFMRRNTFYPQLALLQLGADERYALVDPLAFDIADALRPLERAQVTTLMHSASEDLETLAPWLPQGPGVLFDTQIAAAFAGMGLGISYRALVAELAGAELDKGETRSDWMQRPLTPSQSAYATLDVVYLHTIHQQLAERLAQRDRTSWHAEDCERQKRKSCQRSGDTQPQLALRGAAEWPHQQQALLRRILLWRDHTARQLDRPRPWLAEDALSLSLAQQPPARLDELEKRSSGQRALRSQQRAELFELLAMPISDEEMAATRAIPGFPQGKAKQALSAMKETVDTLAAELDLPPGLLCSRKVLEEYVVTAEWPEALEGWRRGVLHERLSSQLPDA